MANTVNMWMGRNGEYVVPDAIMWLAEQANKRAPLPYQWNRPGFDHPFFKVVEEWGLWRDSQEEAKWLTEK